MPLAPEIIVQVRQRYADGVPVAQICSEFDVSSAQLYVCVDGGPPGSDALPALPRRRIARARQPDVVRRELVERLWRTARTQVQEIELRLAQADRPPPERERDARVMAALVKTLRELTALDQAHNNEIAPKGALQDDDDAIPRDLDDLRRELARRVDLLRQRRNAAGPAGGASA